MAIPNEQKYEQKYPTPEVDPFDNFDEFVNKYQNVYKWTQESGALLFKFNKDRFKQILNFSDADYPRPNSRIAPIRHSVRQIGQFEGFYEVSEAGEDNCTWGAYRKEGDLPGNDIDTCAGMLWNDLNEYVYYNEVEPSKEHKPPLGEVLKHLPEVYAKDFWKMPGITDCFLYYGRKNAMFTMHTEDFFLNSCSFLLEGAPKIWYMVLPKYLHALERATKMMAPFYSRCDQSLRHKTFLFSPYLLAKMGIPYTRVVQHAGEAIITNEATLHQGGSLGVNASVAWNCAGRNWLKFGKLAAACSCFPSSVIIPVEELCRVFLNTAAAYDTQVAQILEDYKNGKGCSIYEWDENTQPFSSAVACYKRIPIPLKYIRINGHYLNCSRERNNAYEYRCCHWSSGCRVALLLRRGNEEAPYGMYQPGTTTEHNHPPLFPSKEQLRMEFGTTQRTKKEEENEDGTDEMPSIEL